MPRPSGDGRLQLFGGGAAVFFGGPGAHERRPHEDAEEQRDGADDGEEGRIDPRHGATDVTRRLRGELEDRGPVHDAQHRLDAARRHFGTSAAHSPGDRLSTRPRIAAGPAASPEPARCAVDRLPLNLAGRARVSEALGDPGRFQAGHRPLTGSLAWSRTWPSAGNGRSQSSTPVPATDDRPRSDQWRLRRHRAYADLVVNAAPLRPRYGKRIPLPLSGT